MDAKGRAVHRSLSLCAVVAALMLSACSGATPTAGPTIEQLRTVLAQSLRGTEEAPPPDVDAAAVMAANQTLQTVYEIRDFHPIWVGPEGANERGQQLLARLSDAEIDALDPGRYGLNEIRHPLTVGDAQGLVSAELYFSRALMRYAADLQGEGEDDVMILAAAGSASDIGSFLDSLIPRDAAYRRLRAAMRLYHGIADEGGWRTIPDGPTLRRGVTDGRILLLRQRLGATGDLAAVEARTDSELFDEAVEAALRRFQLRHGLKEDGIAGVRTLQSLNVPVEDRIAQIADNLERRRNASTEIGEQALVVNIAAQEMVLIDGGAEVLRSRTIIGQTGWETPLLSSEIRAIEINPTWTVPRKIALEEILPLARKAGPEYFDRHGYRLFDARMQELDVTAIEWEKIGDDYMPYVLRQDAGGGNALGRVKFLFPNEQDVYLHDTPGRSLFKRTARTLSHGCVRVEKADELAVLLLQTRAGWSKADYRKALRSGRTIRVMLRDPLPLHIVSVTVWVEENGTVQFRDDPYRRETPNIGKERRNDADGNIL